MGKTKYLKLGTYSFSGRLKTTFLILRGPRNKGGRVYYVALDGTPHEYKNVVDAVYGAKAHVRFMNLFKNRRKR